MVGLVSKIEEKSENDPKKIQDRISRGQEGFIEGNATYIEIRIDSDERKGFYCKVGRKDVETYRERIDKATAGKSLVAIKGTMCPEAPCFLVKGFKVIGEL